MKEKSSIDNVLANIALGALLLICIVPVYMMVITLSQVCEDTDKYLQQFSSLEEFIEAQSTEMLVIEIIMALGLAIMLIVVVIFFSKEIINKISKKI